MEVGKLKRKRKKRQKGSTECIKLILRYKSSKGKKKNHEDKDEDKRNASRFYSMVHKGKSKSMAHFQPFILSANSHPVKYWCFNSNKEMSKWFLVHLSGEIQLSIIDNGWIGKDWNGRGGKCLGLCVCPYACVSGCPLDTVNPPLDSYVIWWPHNGEGLVVSFNKFYKTS